MHEIENSVSGPALYVSPADRADAHLAGFTTQEVAAGLDVLGHPGVRTALAEPREPHDVGIDVREMFEPEGPLGLNSLESQDLLGRVDMDGEGVRARR